MRAVHAVMKKRNEMLVKSYALTNWHVRSLVYLFLDKPSLIQVHRTATLVENGIWGMAIKA